MSNELSSSTARQDFVPQGEYFSTQHDDFLLDTLDDKQTLNIKRLVGNYHSLSLNRIGS